MPNKKIWKIREIEERMIFLKIFFHFILNFSIIYVYKITFEKIIMFIITVFIPLYQ